MYRKSACKEDTYIEGEKKQWFDRLIKLTEVFKNSNLVDWKGCWSNVYGENVKTVIWSTEKEINILENVWWNEKVNKFVLIVIVWLIEKVDKVAYTEVWWKQRFDDQESWQGSIKLRVWCTRRVVGVDFIEGR